MELTVPNPWKAQLKLGLAVLALIVGLGIALYGVNHYLNLRVKAVVAEQRGEVLETASATIADGDAVDETRNADEQATSEAKSDYSNQKEVIYATDPAARDRGSRTVPDSMRGAFRERRLARERSGRLPEQREGEQSGSEAAER